ncbi:MAG: antitoxin family protein [Gemmataceae bacterium]|nr:antitoxin family protein [Gemmataceae bacterium]
MAVTTPAVYENGVLRPIRPLDLKDGELVQLTVSPAPPRPSDEEIVAMMKAAKTPEELFAIANTYMRDQPEDGYDYLEALNENRRRDGARPLYLPEDKGKTW